jgi:hypothetical protein
VVGEKDSSPLSSPGAKAAATLVTGPSTVASRLVHLVEERIFAHFNDAVVKDVKWCILDSGASNHMTDVRAAFTELNTNIHGTIRFGNGSMGEIVGMGMVLFICKSGEHGSLDGVYLILKMTTSIISLGQLDEADFKVSIKAGVTQVFDE